MGNGGSGEKTGAAGGGTAEAGRGSRRCDEMVPAMPWWGGIGGGTESRSAVERLAVDDEGSCPSAARTVEMTEGAYAVEEA